MSMNDKGRHVSVPQPLPANFGPPVPPVGPGPGAGPVVGQQPWGPNPYPMSHQGYPPAFKNGPEYPPNMHPAGYMPRYPAYDAAQCQSFPFGKIHEGPVRPHNPNAFPIVRHYNSQHYNDGPKDGKEGFSRSKSPGHYNDGPKEMFPRNKTGNAYEPCKSPAAKDKNGKNGRDDPPSSPTDSKSDSETNDHTTTESCPDDTRSPASCDKQEGSFFGDKSVSDSNSTDPHPKKLKNNVDSESIDDSQSFSSISNTTTNKKDGHPSFSEMRIHPPYGEYGMFPDGERRMMPPHQMPENFGYRGQNNDKLDSENVFQVPSISSTTPPKVFPPVPPSPMSSESSSWAEDAKYYRHHSSSMSQDMDDADKLPRKKRKRCGECPGCLQKQNCGRCGPCRSVRSHQICKMRKCESLKTKKEKNAGRFRRRNPEGGSLGAATHAAEDAIKCGRKSKDHLLNAIREERNSNSEIAPKMNGNPQSYLSQQDSLSPTNSSSMHMGSQSMRGQMDQYQPQGGNFQPPGMMNSYTSNSQYGSYTPQMPPNTSQMYDSRLSVGMEGAAVDIDELNSTHRMTNTRLKTLIHNRQNQREQLIPISNNSISHDSAYNSSTLSPIVGRQDYGSSLSPVGRYASPYLPPPGNHQDAMHNNMQFQGQSDASTSSLMHLQRLSPNNISPQKVQSSQRPPWSAEMSRKTPEGPMKSPVAAKPSLNGHVANDQETTESKVMNGHDKPPDMNGVSDSGSSDNSNMHNSVAKDHPTETDGKVERRTPVPEIKIPPPNERIPLVPMNDRIQRPQMSPSLHPLPPPNDRVLQPLQSPNDRILQPLQSLNDRVLQPLQSPNLHPLQVPTGSPRYHMPLNNCGPMTPPYGYRHFPPHHQVGLVGNPPGCMPPPSSIPPMAPVANGETPGDEQQPTPSSPFLLNTTTSMNTYTSITSTYSNSKLSFSNATCLPTFALTSVSNSSHTYARAQSWESSSSRFHMLPLGGGTAKSYIDSGRIHHRDSLIERTHPCQDFPFQDLPLQPPPSYPPFGGCLPPSFTPECAPVVSTPDPDPQDRIEKLRTNTKLDPPQCDCLKNKEVLPSEKLPYYTHLGSGSSVSAIRELMECRSGEKGNAIRIEKLLYSGKEGKTSQGCPLAKWIIRRSGPEEKLLTVVRHRPGHTCPTAYIVIAMVAWEGVQETVADVLYRTVTYKTVNFGIPTQRKCGTNEMRTCACQGLDPETCGASFSFGCSWSMYYNGCKFARSKNARKFKLTEKDEEKELEDRLQTLASDVSNLYEKMAPESFYNQTEFEQQASDCRLGVSKGRPFSGVTACLDYCAHSHKDLQNMNNGCTVVVTLNKHKGWDKPEDEQLHVLPLYVMDSTDEFGSKEGQEKKITSGAVEKLDKFSIDYRIRTTPLKPCKTRGRKPKDGFSPRKQALQAAFKQLIASGKLRRIDPPDLYQRPTRALTNSIQPDSSVDNRLPNPQIVGGSFSREETPCKFYAGKHISYGAQSWGNQSLNDNNNPTSVSGNNPLCSYPNSSFPKFEQGVCPQNSSLTNTCSKMTSGTYVTSSCNAPSYNDNNNNYMPSYVPQPQGYRSHNTQSTYSHYYPGMNPPSFGSQHNPVDPYHYSYSHNGPHFENNAFQGQYGYGYPPPNVALKIPGNYSASSYNYQGPQQSGNMNCQSVSYSNSHMTQNNNFCNYTMPKPQAPASFSTANHQNNYQGFYPEQQSTQFSSPNSNTSRVSTPHFQNSPCSGNQSVFVKSENANESFSEKTPPENPDSVYTMTDMDSKSVNCFSTSKQSNPPEKNQIKKEDQETKFYENQNQKAIPNYCCDNESQNKAMSNYRCDNYYPGAKNYNYHLQQSNMVLDFDNFNDIVCNNYETTTEYGTFKEGYEKGVYEPSEPVPNNNNNKDLASMTKMTESPYPFQQKPKETDHLHALTSKYNMEEDENFIDSTTLEGDEVYEGHSDNESSFKDTEVGGVAIALTHGSVLFECAKHELHATTAVRNPNRRNPTRISLVFYQHKHLNFESHGEAEWGQKMKEKRVGNAAKMCFEEAPTIKRQCFEGEEPGKVVTGFAGTTPTTSWVTVFSIAPLAVGAPFRP